MDHGHEYSKALAQLIQLINLLPMQTLYLGLSAMHTAAWAKTRIAGRTNGDYRKLQTMKQFHQPLYQTLMTGFLLSVLLLTGCLPIQPVTGSTLPSGTIPGHSGTAALILTWEGAPLGDGPACAHITIDATGHAAFGACDNIDQTATIGENHLTELDAMQRRFATFSTETAVGTVTFNGSGTSDSAAWQRAIGAWAQLVYGELASVTASATGATVMSWFPGTAPEQPELCTHLTVLVYGYVYADTVPCGGGEVLSTAGGWLNDAQMAQLDHWRTTFAPFSVDNSYLDGDGSQAATEAWQRAVDAWAQVVYGEVRSGQAGAAGATAMSWFIDHAAGSGTLCQHLTVLTFGYAYAEIVPCAGGATVQASGGSLTDAELTQLDRWLADHAALYVDNNYLAGMGSTPMPADDVTAAKSWATALYDRLATMSDSAGMAMDLTTWTAYEADSGFVIYYPPTLYTVDVLPNRTGSPFSGAIVFTPTNALTSREPLAASYRLSILAHVANKAYSLSEGATFLANGQLLSYDPALLDGQTITRTNLAGAPAVRVDDLPVGQAGVTIQLAAIRADIVYELVVEPAQMSSGNADADQANLTLVEQMMQTFHFTR